MTLVAGASADHYSRAEASQLPSYEHRLQKTWNPNWRRMAHVRPALQVFLAVLGDALELPWGALRRRATIFDSSISL